MQIRANKIAVGGWVLVCLGVLLSVMAPLGFALTASGDLIQLAVLVLLALALVRRTNASSGRARLFWILFTLGAVVWVAAQGLWTYFEVFRRQEVPNPFVGDVAIFLHLVPFMAAL